MRSPGIGGCGHCSVDSTKQRPSQLREAQPPEGRPILAKWLERKELKIWGDLTNETKKDDARGWQAGNRWCMRPQAWCEAKSWGVSTVILISR